MSQENDELEISLDVCLYSIINVLLSFQVRNAGDQ